MNLSEDKDCIRSFSPKYETKLDGVDINLNFYDGCKYMFYNFRNLIYKLQSSIITLQ